MNESQTHLKNEFRDREYREAYAEDFLNTNIATQLQVIREQRELTQTKLAEMVGTQQAGISRVENVNYSAWKIETLKKLAFALGCRLKVSIETFGSLIEEATNFSRETLKRPSFEEDPVFKSSIRVKQKAVPALNELYLLANPTIANILSLNVTPHTENLVLLEEDEPVSVGVRSSKYPVDLLANAGH